MIRQGKKLLALGLLGFVVAGAVASVLAASLATYRVNPTDADGRVLPGLYPNVEFDFGYDDNVTRSANAKDSFVAILRPEVQWIGVFSKHAVRLGYQGRYGWAESLSSEDFKDHFIGADVTFDLSRKVDVNLAAAYRREHEDRAAAGTSLFLPGADLNEWEEWVARAELVLGRRIAKAQIVGRVEHAERRFLNNGQQLRNYDANSFVGTFYYNIGPKTQLLVEGRFADFDYLNGVAPGIDQDNQTYALLAGVTWKATAKTTGELKVGRNWKNFSSSAYSDSDGVAIDATVTWKPKSYSVVTLVISRGLHDSSTPGTSTFESTKAQLDWAHDLTRLTQLQAGASVERDDYDLGRQDDLVQAYLGLSYALRRNVTVGVRYDYADRDSNVAGASFKNNRIFLGVKTDFK